MGFVEDSKKRHSVQEAKPYWPGAFDEENADTARHFAMLACALPIVEVYRPESVLSIGDNRGRDAYFFKLKAGCNVVASDLSVDHLERAVADGYLDSVSSVDVEDIPYEDDSFDFVVAKEAFHHWPRPMLGLYECLRVAKYGVMLIEPNDVRRPLDSVPGYPDDKEWRDNYEQVGNYKYQISLREIHKVAWSMYLPAVVAKGFNDPFRPGMPLEEYFSEKERLDVMGRENKRQFNLMFVCIFKVWSSDLLGRLDETYNVRYRPANTLLAGC